MGSERDADERQSSAGAGCRSRSKSHIILPTLTWIMPGGPSVVPERNPALSVSALKKYNELKEAEARSRERAGK